MPPDGVGPPGEGLDRHVLFLLKVAPGMQREVLRLGLLLEAVRHGATSGSREVLLLADTTMPDDVGAAARRLAELEGVESVACSVATPA